MTDMLVGAGIMLVGTLLGYLITAASHKKDDDK